MGRGRKSEPERPLVPPIDFDPGSNGEYCPEPNPARAARANRLFFEIVEDKHRRAGMTRRQFTESACGMAAALAVLNQLACANSAGGDGSAGGEGGSGGQGGTVGMDAAGYDVTPDMLEDETLARDKLTGDEFIFDVQVHTSPSGLRDFEPQSPPDEALDFIKKVFVESDTTVACLTGTPSVRGLGTGNLDAHTKLQAIIKRFGGPRLIFHANADPEGGAAEVEYMAGVVEQYQVSAWKVYPHGSPDRLDSDKFGGPFLEQARKLGVKVVAAHRGISGGGDYSAAGSPRDLVQAAKMFPDIKFLTYHAGWETNAEERAPFDENAANPRGVDRLIKAVRDNQIGNDGNVYAELGSTWHRLIDDPVAAAHVLGKLLKYLGPDRVIWGTDSVFNPTVSQIAAMRAFTIPESMQQMHGYPALTRELKAKIFGLNAAPVYGIDPAAIRYGIEGDEIDQLKMAYRHDRRAVPMPHPLRFVGPRNRREFLAFRRLEAREAAARGRRC